jgi:polysaccharide export outer membrane protein
LRLLTLTLAILLTAAQAHAADDHLHPRPRYALQYGDALALEYRYTPEFNQTVTIQPDGFVNLTLIGDLKVSGLTVAQVHDLILQRVAGRLNQPELTVVLKEFERPYIAVSGEVDKPGRLAFAEHTTALQAIKLSGGFKGSAQQSEVLVFRHVNGDLDQVIQLNLHHIDTSRSLERDMVLQPGDIVLVPRNKLENLARFIKATNLGLYLDPLTYAAK